MHLEYGTCPYCGSRNARHDGHDVNRDAIPAYTYDFWTCKACGREWTDVYEMVEQRDEEADPI